MTRSLGVSFLLVAFGLNLVPLRAADLPVAPVSGGTTASGSGWVPDTNDFHIEPGPEDGRVAFVTARLLERFHYSHHPFDEMISSRFLDRYLESLDPQHWYFLQTDLDQFEPYRTNLDHLTITREAVAETAPAFVIFSRFAERLKQRVACVDDLLQHDPFEFGADERMVVNRHDSPYPRDLTEARQIWRQRLRYEYLLEKLALEDPGKSRTNNAKALTGQTLHQQIAETLTRRYHRNLRAFTDWNHEDVLGIYLTALTHAYDPHSDFLIPEQMDNFRMSMSLELFGIGAELRSDDGYCKILRLLPGPAAKSKKIKEGDRIVAVAQSNQPPMDVVDMNLSKAVQLIRGPKGTEVRLTIIPAGDASARNIVALVRDEIALEDQAAKGRIIDQPDGAGKSLRLGIVDLPSFYAAMDLPRGKPAGSAAAGFPAHSASADVAKLLNKFKQEHVRGIILDLRRNGGGSLEEAVKLTGLFIKEGPVVQVRALDGSIQVDRDEDPSIAYDGPLIVLTSRFSASASEIVAGALQDYGRAIIVGDNSTHGKGTVQNLNSLRPFMRMADSDAGDPGALKVTIRKFYRASGASTQLKGVMPDIVLPSILNYSKDLGESSLDNPLPWDTIPGVKFDKLNLVQPYLSELLRRSTERVATNRDFVYVREDIEQFRKREADKTVSLNEKTELQEIQEAENRQKARDKELLARGEPDEKVYEITLKQADLPGLPEPLRVTNSLAAAAASGITPATGANPASLAGVLPAAHPGADADPDEIKPAPVDVDLVESEHILADYLLLLPRNSLLTTNQ